MTEKTIKIETVGPGPLYIVAEDMSDMEREAFLIQWRHAIASGKLPKQSSVILRPMDIDSLEMTAHIIMCNDTPIEVHLSSEVAKERRDKLQAEHNSVYMSEHWGRQSYYRVEVVPLHITFPEKVNLPKEETYHGETTPATDSD